MRLLAAVLLWLAATCACLANSAGEGKPADASDPNQQVLVLLRLPPEHFRPDANYAGSYGDGLGHSARKRIAAQLAREHGLKLMTDWPMPVLGVDCYVMAVPAGQVPERVAEALSHDARVEWAQTMNVYQAQGAAPSEMVGHRDPLYPVQPVARAWHLAELHELATGRSVRVAVVDSGVEGGHPDLAGQLMLSENFVDGRPAAAEWHGTAVAGLIAARADNGVGIAGVAPRARLMALRACWQAAAAEPTLCTSLSLAMALHFAIAHDAQVINLSLSGPQDRLLGQLLSAALARGITVVAAASRTMPKGGFPASHVGVVAVVDEDGGPVPAGALAAPGRDVPTTVPGARWQFVTGASYAAAQVSGLFALLRELRPLGLGPASAAVVPLPGGGIDACATLARAAAGGCACSCAAAASLPPLARQ